MKYTIPIDPKPQSRPRFTSQGFRRAYEKADMKAYKRAVAYHVMSQNPKKIEKGPVAITVRCFIYPPKYILNVKSKRRALEEETMSVDKKSDLDNYFKAITDAVNGILYKDDGQIARMSATKVYSLNPRTEIEIEEMSL